jgi:dienelactone hydrolase
MADLAITTTERNQRGSRSTAASCVLAAALVLSGSVDSHAQGTTGAEVQAPAAADTRQSLYSVPVIDAGRRTTFLKTRICQPSGEGPSTLVVINHGSPPNAERPKMSLGSCEQEAAQWFIGRGYVVVFALRRGYGETGGVWAEDFGDCDHADYFRAGLETARDIAAVVIFATGLPFVRPQGAVVVGQSAGGWGTIAYDSVPHDKVAAFVVMAGGRGGYRKNLPNNNCRPELLVESAARYGTNARTPMLWIYTANDSYFGPPLARAMWQAFSRRGGEADLEQPGPYNQDGHHLFFGPGGSVIWGPLVERYFARRGISP